MIKIDQLISELLQPCSKPATGFENTLNVLHIDWQPIRRSDNYRNK